MDHVVQLNHVKQIAPFLAIARQGWRAGTTNLALCIFVKYKISGIQNMLIFFTRNNDGHLPS
jgi:hypothetical protein